MSGECISLHSVTHRLPLTTIKMHIETLKVFCDLVETQSFSLAAERNFVTQSAVSQQVKTLEDKFNRRLLERVRGRREEILIFNLAHNASIKSSKSQCRARRRVHQNPPKYLSAVLSSRPAQTANFFAAHSWAAARCSKYKSVL